MHGGKGVHRFVREKLPELRDRREGQQAVQDEEYTALTPDLVRSELRRLD